MKYEDIEQYFSNDTKLTTLMNNLKDMFDTIDDYATQFSQGIDNTIEELQQTKRILTGIVASLNPVYSKALSMKKQMEYRYYVQKKHDCEAGTVVDGSGKPAKFADGATEKEAKDAVKIYRDIRDILCGYIKAAEALIYDCKDRIEQNRKEYPGKNE